MNCILLMRWTLKPKPDSKLVDQLSKELGVEKSTATLLVQRGINTFPMDDISRDHYMAFAVARLRMFETMEQMVWACKLK